jgi:hypothetical protein
VPLGPYYGVQAILGDSIANLAGQLNSVTMTSVARRTLIRAASTRASPGGGLPGPPPHRAGSQRLGTTWLSESESETLMPGLCPLPGLSAGPPSSESSRPPTSSESRVVVAGPSAGGRLTGIADSELLLRSLRFLSFIRSQDSIANGALVIARLQLAIGIRPVGRKAHNAGPGPGPPSPPSLSPPSGLGREPRRGI